MISDNQGTMNKEEIFQIIVNHIREVLPELVEHQIQHSDSLRDLGANSVDRAEVVTLTLESLELNIPRTELFGANNIGELVGLLYEQLQSH